MTETDRTSRIHRLPTVLANQIAAGEVVERPASVAKELLENSLDAGARSISVDVERGGVGLIRVRDDGTSIHREDLALALDRHATSKVSSLEELERVTSLGFRGEALPSIASVSRLVMTSRRADEDGGWRVVAEGGPPTEAPAPVPHPPGTTVEVRDLFYNTPARRKFLRAERTEFGHVHEVIKRSALSRFDMGIRLRHDGRSMLSLSAGDGEAQRTRRLAAVCGGAFVENALALEYEAMDLRLWGWIGRPDYSRSQSDLQYFYLNGRPVRDRLVQHAVRQAYQDLIYQGRHPAYVLHLEMGPGVADVNVHPTKQEVRFREARLVHDFIYRCAARALGSSAGAAHTGPPSAWRSGGGRVSPGPHAVREAMNDYAALTGVPAHVGGASADTPPLGQALASVEGDYLLARNAGGLVLVDLPAARQRVTHRRLADSLAGEGIRSQPLLVPLSLSFDPALAALVEERHELLLELGLDLTRLGPDSIGVHRLPTLLRASDPAKLVSAVLKALKDLDQGRVKSSPRENLLPAMAAHAGSTPEPETLAQLDALLRELERLDPDPSSRPVWVQVTVDDLAGFFGRQRPAPGTRQATTGRVPLA